MEPNTNEIEDLKEILKMAQSLSQPDQQAPVVVEGDEAEENNQQAPGADDYNDDADDGDDEVARLKRENQELRDKARKRREKKRSERRSSSPSNPSADDAPRYLTQEDLDRRDLIREGHSEEMANEIVDRARMRKASASDVARESYYQAQLLMKKEREKTQKAMVIDSNGVRKPAKKTVDYYLRNNVTPKRSDDPALYREWKHARKERSGSRRAK